MPIQDKTQLITQLATGVTTYSFQDELHDLQSSSIIELFEVNANKYGLGVYRFHPGKVLNGDLIYDNKVYKSIPLEMDEVETRGDGTLPRPKLRIANVDGFVSDIINGRDDFVGLHFTRKRIFLKYLDAANFRNDKNPFGDPDIHARFPDDKFVINQKLNEDKNVVEFELVSVLEMDTVKLPSRQIISNYCNWVYRGDGCNYGNQAYNPIEKFGGEKNSDQALGKPIADAKDKLFNYPSASGGYGIDDAPAINVAWNTYDSDGELNGELFHNSGTYQRTGIYLSGDTVQIQGIDNADENAFMTDSNITLYFVAKPTGQSVTEINGVAFTHNNVSGSDPRSDKLNWAQDQCSKTISGCSLRFKHCGGGLPFGGFPGTDKFGYV
jgi:lambda family phage minor tail protein L